MALSVRRSRGVSVRLGRPRENEHQHADRADGEQRAEAEVPSVVLDHVAETDTGNERAGVTKQTREASGGGGADILSGGTGNDIFRDIAANLNGDTITDFAVGDSIVITNASGA